MSSAHTPSDSHPDSSGHSPEPEAFPETEVEYSQVRIRRAPSIPAFMILGLVVGLIVAFVSVWFGPGNPSYTFEAVFGVTQCVAGPRHTRGTPPSVVEASAFVWCALTLGALGWADALGSAQLSASGERSDISRYFPLF